LFYIDLKEKTIKGEISLTDEKKLVVLKRSNWQVEMPKRVYNLTSKGGNTTKSMDRSDQSGFRTTLMG
jgi:hypothetical protein